MPLLLNGIVMWSGALNEIPNNFVLCDGTNGTPDLIDKFIIGSGSTYVPDDTGGFANVAVASHSHTMSGSSGSGNFTHLHSSNIDTKPDFTCCSSGPVRGSSNYGLSTTTNASNHAHSVSLSTAGEGEDGIGKNLPPYYALAFIMQTS